MQGPVRGVPPCKAFYNGSCDNVACPRSPVVVAVQVTFSSTTLAQSLTSKALAEYFKPWKPSCAFLKNSIGFVIFPSLELFNAVCVMCDMRFAEFSPNDPKKKLKQDPLQRPCREYYEREIVLIERVLLFTAVRYPFSSIFLCSCFYICF
jgi:hypothetical protein